MRSAIITRSLTTTLVLCCAPAMTRGQATQTFLVHGTLRSCSAITQMDSALADNSQQFFSGWNEKDYADAAAWAQSCADYGWHVAGRPRLPLLQAQHDMALGAGQKHVEGTGTSEAPATATAQTAAPAGEAASAAVPAMQPAPSYATQPAASAAQPAASAVQPAASAVQPAASAVQPAASATQPAASAAQPGASAVQLAVAAAQPAVSAAQPAIPAEQAAIPATQAVLATQVVPNVAASQGITPTPNIAATLSAGPRPGSAAVESAAAEASAPVQAGGASVTPVPVAAPPVTPATVSVATPVAGGSAAGAAQEPLLASAAPGIPLATSAAQTNLAAQAVPASAMAIGGPVAVGGRASDPAEESVVTGEYFRKHFHQESLWVANRAHLDIGEDRGPPTWPTGGTSAQLKNRLTADKIVLYCARKTNASESSGRQATDQTNQPLMWDWRWCEAEEAAAYSRLVSGNEFPSAGRGVVLGCAGSDSYIYTERCIQTLIESARN